MKLSVWTAALAVAIAATMACSDLPETMGNDLSSVTEGELVSTLCGGPKGLLCAKDEYCKKRVDTCGDAAAYGTCTARPTICPLYYKPVCGCDGKTYGNDCELAASGVNKKADGPCPSACSLGANDCPQGSVCDPVPGCGDSIAGTCVPKPTACPRTWAPVCGCDGKTYPNDCTRLLVGADKAHDGACPATCGGITGKVCPAGRYCDFPAGTCGTGDQEGVCKAPPHVCPDVWAPVCGCDGKTYGNDCERAAAGASKLHDGACKPVSECQTNEDCKKGDYCSLETFCICPPDTDPACLAPCLLVGTCRPMCEILDPLPYELCGDGIDNDCNGLVDDGCKCATDADCPPKTWCQWLGLESPACMPIPDGACNDDGDCKDGQVCDPPQVCPMCIGCPCFGQCVDPVPPSGCCKTDADCPSGKCVGTVCKDEPPAGSCWSDSDCVMGATCKDEFVCPCGALCGPLPDKLGTCAYDYPPCGGSGTCPAGSVCQCLPDPTCPACTVCWFGCVPKS
ncbi:MAG: hypothetical protein AMXMBFR64_08580 [Myxococcales bacterium]